MKIGLCNEAFGELFQLEHLDLAKECGYDGIEIAPYTIAGTVYKISQGMRKAIRDRCDRIG